MLIRASIKDNMMVVCEIKEDGTCLDIKSMLEDENIILRYPNLYLTSSSLEVPFLTDSTCLDFSQVVTLMMTNLDGMTDDVLVKIKDALYDSTKFELHTYRGVVECLKSLLSYLSGEEKVTINFPIENYENYQVTKRLVDSINQKSGVFNVKDNVTKFRTTPDDELFIYIPRPDALSYTENVYSLIPPITDVFVPYNDPKLATYEYKNYLASSGQTIEEVIGSPENNTNEIFPEEKRYYEQLCSLLDACLKIEYPNQSIEECRECKVVSNSFRDYITALIIAVITYHSNQSGYMPLDVFWESDSDEDDDSDSGDTSMSSSLDAGVMYSPAKKADSDGIDIIEDLIKNQSRKDIYAPINLLIQCLRFGKKKPNKLTLVDDKHFFDLNHFVYSNNSGSYDSYTVKKTPSGCNYSIASVIKASNRITDNNFLRDNSVFKAAIDCPVGLLLEKQFNDTDEVQYVALSIVDLITWSGKDEDLTIEGVELVNGMVTINPSKVDPAIINLDLTLSIQKMDETLRNTADAGFVSYTSEYLRDAYFGANSFTNSLNILSIYNKFVDKSDLTNIAKFEVISEDELDLKAREYQLQKTYFLDITVGLKMSKLIAKVNNEYFGMQELNSNVTINDVLKIYIEMMKDIGYYGEVFSMEMLTTGSPMGDKVGSMKASQAFGSAPSQPVEDKDITDEVINEVPVGKNMYNLDLLYESASFSSVVPIILSQELVESVNRAYSEINNPFRIKDFGPLKGDRIVGFLAQVNGKFILLEPKEYNLPLSNRFNLIKFRANILALLRLISLGKDSKVKFDSQTTLEYYCRILEKC